MQYVLSFKIKSVFRLKFFGIIAVQENANVPIATSPLDKQVIWISEM